MLLVPSPPKKKQVAESPMTRTQGSIEALPETMVFTIKIIKDMRDFLRVFLPTLGKDGFWMVLVPGSWVDLLMAASQAPRRAGHVVLFVRRGEGAQTRSTEGVGPESQALRKNWGKPM